MIDIGIIIAMAISLTPIISEKLHIHKKMRAWTALVLIVLLNIANTILFGDHAVIDAIRQGIRDGVVAIGIYSTGKNTMEYVANRKNNNSQEK
ncbi:hypothetical protein [Tepidibacillus fermentans]|uniref:Uncharacterized protein n=1 Tax=Tepidibacillus fermentans TaxID=1281767 RepID=A0A4R3KJ21_9BACI|nr:hypothetical protein [Tepidibacillus fermentans]TCS83546.1 hypothetical protein EDD72_104100 [Tepidibacillus fermentans]